MGLIEFVIFGTIAVVVLAIVIGGVTTFLKIKRKIENTSNALFGTPDVLEGVVKAKQQIERADIGAPEPKSVSGMTRLLEPQILRDFPDFSWIEFKGKAENMLYSAFVAITEQNLSHLTEDASKEVFNELQSRLTENRANGVREFYKDIEIHQTEIANYRKLAGKRSITIQSSVGYLYYKEKDGHTIGGHQDRRTETKYTIELEYVQDVTQLTGEATAFGTTCPNCGAPIARVGQMYCEFCGSGVTPVNIRVWSLHKFYEVDYNHI